MPSAVDELLAEYEDPSRFATAIEDYVLSLLGPDGFAGLSEAEQTVYCMDELEREVNDGGFSQFYVNSAGEQAVETVAALKRIGAMRCAALVEQANVVFGEGGPSKDRDKRQKQVARLGKGAASLWNELDQAFFEYPDKLAMLLREYVAAHRAEIPLCQYE